MGPTSWTVDKPTVSPAGLRAKANSEPQGGMKYDSGKPRVDLLDADALEGLAKVLTFGAQKYEAHNWRRGIAWSRLVAALLRHTFAILRGEYTDPESGLPHVDHIGCCWMFLSNHMKNRQELNDLWIPSKETDASGTSKPA